MSVSAVKEMKTLESSLYRDSYLFAAIESWEQRGFPWGNIVTKLEKEVDAVPK